MEPYYEDYDWHKDEWLWSSRKPYRYETHPPKPIQPGMERVYIDDLKPGDLVTIFDTGHPNGRDAMFWEDMGMVDLMKGNSHSPYLAQAIRFLTWNEDKTDVRIDSVDFPTYTGDRGLVDPDNNPHGTYIHKTHYVIRRQA